MEGWQSLILFRLVLPLAFLISVSLRPFGLSIVFLILYLWFPLLSTSVTNGRRASLFTLIVSSIMLLLQVSWHVFLAVNQPELLQQTTCSGVYEIFVNIGLCSYTKISYILALQWGAPELVAVIASLIVYMMLKRSEKSGNTHKMRKTRDYPLLTNAGKYLSLFLILLSGSIEPGLFSAVYFLAFIVMTTLWALDLSTDRCFAISFRFLMTFMFLHITILLVYQSTYVTDLLPEEDPIPRWLGLTKFVNITCSSENNSPIIASYTYSSSNVPTYLSPLMILITYYILSLESRELLKPSGRKKMLGLSRYAPDKMNTSKSSSLRRLSNRFKSEKWKTATYKASEACPKVESASGHASPTERTPLVRKKSTKDSPTKSKLILRGSSVSTTVPHGPEELENSVLDEILNLIASFFHVMIRSSYIATSIVMMTWSILFHSWLGFAFLIWANIVWLKQNQRNFMLRSSPLLVCYAIFLLLSQYVLSMKLTEEELPLESQDVNMKQIGFSKTPENQYPCQPLIIKSLLSCMFWITLRERTRDKLRRRRSSTIADMAAPLQLTMRTAAPEIQEEEIHESRLLKIFGIWLKAFCTKYWIYIVAIMLFVIGITGERMTIFRIIYMFLFLSFILLFQISYSLWRRFLYVFWLSVIGYSMINLILVYTYQFDNTPNIIENYLHISKTLQQDLGLEQINPADLFFRLLTPTLFLIITIMQVHYFHNDFLEMSKFKSRTSSRLEARKSDKDAPESTYIVAQEQDVSLTQSGIARSGSVIYTNPKITSQSTTEHTSNEFKNAFMSLCQRFKLFVDKALDLIFLYMEMNLTKLIFISLMFLCVFNTCALHVPIMIIICPLLLLDRYKQKISLHLCSVLVSVYVMTLMIYQIKYINHSDFDVNCTETYNNGNFSIQKYNTAEWLGFRKTSPDKSLAHILKGYIGIIAVMTLHSVVVYRQMKTRSFLRTNRLAEKIMFPEVTRADADKDLVNCLKYLFNYGYYKFGVEVTLIWLVGLIASRMDAYACVYSIWFTVLVVKKRKDLKVIWPIFTVFIVVILPLQYLIALGVIPVFCVQYPWTDDPFGKEEQYGPLRRWFFLPYAKDPPQATKLIFDYFLLLFCVRQLRVFSIEKTFKGNYPGGDNSEDIGQDWETTTFVNPVPDFTYFVSSYLDILKRAVLLGMLWITLAVMFLTGTNRVNLFSMGYLVGAFIFLWQGTDFYLRPKDAILKWWSKLLYYNVFVVVCKTFLQILGCLFIKNMERNMCWLVQLLGIGCVDKFAGGTLSKFITMERFTKSEAECSVPQEDIGLAWDAVCFGFLLLQRRLFHSYYFYRIIDESKATTILASRGAELIEELRQKQMTQQEEQEKKILQKIKAKMERIKAHQKKIQGPGEPPHHDADEDDEEGTSAEAPLESMERGYRTPESTSPTSPGYNFRTPQPSPPESPPSQRSLPITPPPERRGRAPPPPPITIPQHIQAGAPPSPSSAVMTGSLDAYLEPRRVSLNTGVFSPRQPPRRRFTIPATPPSHHTCDTTDGTCHRRAPIFRHQAIQIPFDRPMFRKHEPTSHQQAIRSGDYYMFDEFDEVDDVREIEESQKGSSDEQLPKELGVGQLLTNVIKTADMRQALSMRRASAPPQTRSRSRSISFRSFRMVRSDGARGQVSQRDDETIHDDTTLKEARDELEGFVEPEEQSKWRRIVTFVDFIWTFIESILTTITRHLLKHSRDYRYISKTLMYEKKVLKERPDFGIGIREGSHRIWQPVLGINVRRVSDSGSDTSQEIDNNTLDLPPSRKVSDLSVPEIRILAPSLEKGLDKSGSALSSREHLEIDDKHQEQIEIIIDSSKLGSDRESDLDAEKDVTTPSQRPRHYSIYSIRSTDSKDITTLEEQDDSMFTKDKPIIIHFIYALWYLVISHTDIVCYLMVFINQIQSATLLSIPLPLMVFLWGTLTIPRPTKTFWITLIAYTEIIVLIKCMFQFELLPWNQKLLPQKQPHSAPRIIGIERKANYALYDLILLLLIFLHRFILKSLGLWNIKMKDKQHLREDALYPIEEKDISLLSESGGVTEIAKKYAERHLRLGPMHVFETAKDPPDEVIEEEENDDSEQVEQRSENKQNPVPGTSSNESSKRHSVSFNETANKISEDHIFDIDSSFKLEDIDSSDPPMIAVSTSIEETKDNIPRVLSLTWKRYTEPVRLFFRTMLDRTARVTADVYAYMFMCDFFNFLVVIFGFAAFGTHQGDGGVQAYLEENKVPIPFLVMLILQFALIVIDRALYLRKYILGKILFQYALIIGVHIWMFFVLPFITERKFNSLLPPPLWYMVKCIYLLLSAYQIRCGYPARILGNFLTKGYNYVNMYLFRAFMAVPFVFELRTLMDWIWTNTSMTLQDWLKMEDIFANVFLLKCSRYVEDEFPQTRGRKKPNVVKYLVGGTALIFIIAIIWFPLVLFAFGNTVGISNPPTDVTVKIRIGPYLPAYIMSAQSNNIISYTRFDYDKMINLYEKDRSALTFLSNYLYDDVSVVELSPYSTSVWAISPPELSKLKEEIQHYNSTLNKTVTVKFTFVITHPSNSKDNPPTIEEEIERHLPTDLFSPLDSFLTNNSTSEKIFASDWITIPYLVPKFLKVFNKGSAKPVSQLITPESVQYNDARSYRDVKMRLTKSDYAMYWEVQEVCDGNKTKHSDMVLRLIPKNKCDGIVIFTFNDKLFPATLNFISGSGIIGLYTTFVFLASRMLRNFFSGIYTKIMFDDLPYVDRVLQLCLDIYLVREASELALEEDLFAKLVFLYRSPETMIKWTRPRELPAIQSPRI